MRLNDPSFPVSSTDPALSDSALGVVGGLVKLMSFQQIKNAVDSVGGSSVTVEDVLTSTNTDNALSAAQGKILNDALVLKAPLASPVFSGTPTAPTADTGTSTTQIASTAFVQQEISQITPAIIGAEESGAAATALTDAKNYADGLLVNLCPLVDGKVPSVNLPSYVDDVLEYANLASFPTTGETGKLYIAINTSLIYRWTGSTYATTSTALALGETSETAYRGDRGKTAYDHSQATGNPHNVTKSDIGLANVDNTSDDNKPISSATQTALDAKASIANQRYVFVSDANTTYTVPASAVTANGNTIIELSNNSLTSITVNAATSTGKTAGDSVTILITGTYAAQLLVASGVTLNGTLAFSANAKIKTLIYRGSNTWSVLGG